MNSGRVPGTADRSADDGDGRAAEVLPLFLGLMAHDLRGSLNTIAGSVHLLARGNGSSAPAELVGRIERAVAEQARVAEDLLRTGMLLAGAQSPERGAVALRPVVTSLQSALSASIAQRGLTVRIDVPARLTATTDRDAVERLIFRALSASVGAIARGGRLVVTAALPEPETLMLTLQRLHPEGAELVSELRTNSWWPILLELARLSDCTLATEREEAGESLLIGFVAGPEARGGG